ncbi:hypothetical protein AGMMS49525_10310 [Bacteroidia bacterium]|nr:hypothetical protein AGMMS49525_10310 [Bacteroidia bacterium]
MKTLKSNAQELLATVTETAVFLSNLKGEIYKQFPIEHFKSEKFTEEVEFPADFEKEKEKFNAENSAKKAKREEYYRLQAIRYQEERKKNLLNLWDWRRGRIDAYLVAKYVESANEMYNGDVSGYNQELIFGKDAAIARFEELKESENPEMEQGGYGNFGNQNNCYFVTEIMEAYKPFTEIERIKITSIDELEANLRDRAESIESNRYAPSIEDADYIVTYGRNSFGRFSKSIIDSVEERITWSSWRGDCHYSSQLTTADLGCDQGAIKLSDLDSNNFEIANKLYERDLINKQTAKELGVYVEDDDNEE